MKKSYNILICPLGWGLGHAGRMIPLARKLIEMGHHVIIAAGKEQLELFREEFRNIPAVSFPGFRPVYSKHLPQYIPLLFEIPALLYHTAREHIKLRKLINEFSIDLVISDNRFGLWNKKVRTVYVTHMPRIPFPHPFRFLEFIGIFLHRAVIRKYDFCYIPDLPGDINLSGRLSHGLRLPDSVRFIGILSRFTEYKETSRPLNPSPEWRTVILSGPEPQRTMLKHKIIELVGDDLSNTVFFEGNPGKNRSKVVSGHFTFHSHPATPEMQRLIRDSGSIITRSGYSVIMELISMNRGALLIPTPGQTEQEYLACLMSSRGWFTSVSQGRLGKDVIHSAAIAVNHEEIARESALLLSNALKELLE